MTEEIRERQFHTGAVELSYAEGPPNGPPLVYLHGGSGRWQHGGRFVELMAERWHVYGVDLRGHGKSGWVTGHYRIREYAADVAAFLPGAVGMPAALYGHSLGGQVALLVAAEHPDLVGALVLGDIPLGDEDTVREPGHQRMITFWRELAASDRSAEEIAAALREMPLPRDGRRAGDVFGEDSPWFPFMGETLAQHDPDVLTFVIDRRAEMLEGYDVLALLPRVACPTLLVLADQAVDGLVSDADAEPALGLLARGESVRMDGIGHPLHATHPEPVARVIGAFLDATVPSSRSSTPWQRSARMPGGRSSRFRDRLRADPDGAPDRWYTPLATTCPPSSGRKGGSPATDRRHRGAPPHRGLTQDGSPSG